MRKRKKELTQRQQFIIALRGLGFGFDRIGLDYQRKFQTKAKLGRDRIRDILAYTGFENL